MFEYEIINGVSVNWYSAKTINFETKHSLRRIMKKGHSELTPMIFDIGLTHLGSEPSIYFVFHEFASIISNLKNYWNN